MRARSNLSGFIAFCIIIVKLYFKYGAKDSGKSAGALMDKSRQDAPEPLPCPWCGEVMERGHLISRGGDIFWYAGGPSLRKRLDQKTIPLKVDTEGCSLEQYRTTWLCSRCRKMVLDAPDPDEPTPTERLLRPER